MTPLGPRPRRMDAAYRRCLTHVMRVAIPFAVVAGGAALLGRQVDLIALALAAIGGYWMGRP